MAVTLWRSTHPAVLRLDLVGISAAARRPRVLHPYQIWQRESASHSDRQSTSDFPGRRAAALPAA